MSKTFANDKIDVACPKCGHETKQTIRRLEQNPQLTCPGCRGLIDVDATELRKGLADVDKALAAFKRKF